MTEPAPVERITRLLAFMLRHQPDNFDLEVDAFGWADLDDVVRALNERIGENVDADDVEEAIEAGDRQRYEIEGERIRALYGHSIAVEPGPTAKPAERLFVGLSAANAKRALSDGLRSGRLRFIHLATSEEDAVEAGRRSGEDYTVLEIRALDAWEEGYNFYDRKSLFLAEEVPAGFLEEGETFHDGFPPRERPGRRERSDGGERRGGGGRGGRRGGGDRGRDRERSPRGRGERSGRERDERPAREREERPDREERPERSEQRGSDRSEQRDRGGRNRNRDSRARDEKSSSSDRETGSREDGASRERGRSRERASEQRDSRELSPKPPARKPERSDSKSKSAPAPSSGFGEGIFESKSTPKRDEGRSSRPKPSKPRAPEREEPRDVQKSGNDDGGGGGFGAGL